jgi:hypothetical protein
VKSERSRSTLLAHIVVLAYEQPNKAEGMMDHHFKYRVRVALCSTIYISYDLPELMKFFGNCTFEKWTQHLGGSESASCECRGNGCHLDISIILLSRFSGMRAIRLCQFDSADRTPQQISTPFASPFSWQRLTSNQKLERARYE